MNLLRVQSLSINESDVVIPIFILKAAYVRLYQGLLQYKSSFFVYYNAWLLFAMDSNIAIIFVAIGDTLKVTLSQVSEAESLYKT